MIVDCKHRFDARVTLWPFSIGLWFRIRSHCYVFAYHPGTLILVNSGDNHTLFKVYGRFKDQRNMVDKWKPIPMLTETQQEYKLGERER